VELMFKLQLYFAFIPVYSVSDIKLHKSIDFNVLLEYLNKCMLVVNINLMYFYIWLMFLLNGQWTSVKFRVSVRVYLILNLNRIKLLFENWIKVSV